MDASEILRTVAALSSRTVRAERIVSKYEQELAATRRTLEQTRVDFEETVKVAELLYKTNRRVGAVTDYLLKKHEMSQDDENPKSFEEMFSWVQRQAESEAQSNSEGENKDGSSSGEARPAD